MSDHPLDVIENEINTFLDNRYPTGAPFKVTVPEAERDILAEVIFLFKKHLPDELVEPVVYIDADRVINIWLKGAV